MSRTGRPDVVAWWAMGGMSLSLLARAARHGLPAVAFVHDDWLVYGPAVDQWLRSFRGWRRPVGAAMQRLTRIPTRLEVRAVARWVFVSAFTRDRALAAGHRADGRGGGPLRHRPGLHRAGLATRLGLAPALPRADRRTQGSRHGDRGDEPAAGGGDAHDHGRRRRAPPRAAASAGRRRSMAGCTSGRRARAPSSRRSSTTTTPSSSRLAGRSRGGWFRSRPWPAAGQW